MIQRLYKKDFSHHIQKDMEMLVFGHAGIPVIFFPTRTARFFDYEDWKVIDGLNDKLEKGQIQIFCLDSADKLSFYDKTLHPSEKISKHLNFEKYVLFEVIPMIRTMNNHPGMELAGCSLGAYHALNICFRHPTLFTKVVAMSGRYDLTLKLRYFEDLFEGFRNDEIYYNMPSQYVPNIHGERMLELLRNLDITIVIGKEDAFLQNNIELSEALNAKKIPHKFFIWDGEAHRGIIWREMLKLYF